MKMNATLERLRARREELGGEGGFTLIELLIVIVILAILAAIVVFAVQNLTGSSAKASCESDVQTVDHAIQAYVAQVGSQPAAGAIVSGQGLMATATGVNGDTVGPWLRNIPTNGNHYSISLVAVTGKYAGTYAQVTAPVGTGATVVDYEPGAVAGTGIATTPSTACANVKS